MTELTCTCKASFEYLESLLGGERVAEMINSIGMDCAAFTMHNLQDQGLSVRGCALAFYAGLLWAEECRRKHEALHALPAPEIITGAIKYLKYMLGKDQAQFILSHFHPEDVARVASELTFHPLCTSVRMLALFMLGVMYAGIAEDTRVSKGLLN